jgi:hypothetical protein
MKRFNITTELLCTIQMIEEKQQILTTIETKLRDEFKQMYEQELKIKEEEKQQMKSMYFHTYVFFRELKFIQNPKISFFLNFSYTFC